MWIPRLSSGSGRLVSCGLPLFLGVCSFATAVEIAAHDAPKVSTEALKAEAKKFWSVEQTLENLGSGPLAPDGLLKLEAEVKAAAEDANAAATGVKDENALIKKLDSEAKMVMQDLRAFGKELRQKQDSLAKAQHEQAKSTLEDALFDELLALQDEPLPSQLKVLRKGVYAKIADAQVLLRNPGHSTPLAEQLGRMMDRKAEKESRMRASGLDGGKGKGGKASPLQVGKAAKRAAANLLLRTKISEAKAKKLAPISGSGLAH